MENKGKPIKTGRSIDGRSRKRNIVEKWEAVSIFADEQKLRIFSLIKLGDFSFVERGMKCLGSFRSSTDRGIP